MAKTKCKTPGRKELYEMDRPYFGYSASEWIDKKDEHKDTKYQGCTTCHRIKEFSNFKSEFSGKDLKRCHFCQNRQFHRWRIDGHASSRTGGIFNTNMLLYTNDHLIQNFRDLDLTSLTNKNKTAILYNNLRKRWINGQNPITCGCGHVFNNKESVKTHVIKQECMQNSKLEDESILNN